METQAEPRRQRQKVTPIDWSATAELHADGGFADRGGAGGIEDNGGTRGKEEPAVYPEAWWSVAQPG